MIEIDLNAIQKAEKRVYVKVTPKRKAHYRTIKVKPGDEVDTEADTKLSSPIKRMHIESRRDDTKVQEILDVGGWDMAKAKIFNLVGNCAYASFHVEGGAIYAMHFLDKREPGVVKIMDLEVNPDMKRQGYGRKAMQDIVRENLEANKIYLASADQESDKFYDAIGMVRLPPRGAGYMQQFEGDKEWMKKIMNMKST